MAKKSKVLLSIILCMVMLLCTACGGDDTEDVTDNSKSTNTAQSTEGTQNKSDTGSTGSSQSTTVTNASTDSETTGNVQNNAEADTWAVYWYLCGSNLESENGCATSDLSELIQVELPENVKFVIETGGSYAWQNSLVDADKLQRFVYDSNDIYLVDEQESANMGDPQTLAEFLYFAKTNYPAEKTAVIFWNHGGGTLSGAAFDEIYEDDSLSLPELYAAFDAVWPSNDENPALELIGFDTCLMATIDTADALNGFAKYLVASEECEPGNGWNYTGFAQALALDPSINGAQLGRAICDSYYEGCCEVGTEAEATLALIDLTKLPRLLAGYEAMGQEALAVAADEPGFFAELGRTAGAVENYGGNTKDRGYTDMMDLGHLARKTSWMLSSAQEVSDALSECVLYKVNGDYRSEATGLSCYYCYDGDVDNFLTFNEVGTGLAFKHLFAYLLTGEISDATAEYLESINIQTLPEIVSMDTLGWNGIKSDLDENNNSYIVLGEEAKDILASIGFSLFYTDVENDFMLYLGTDNDMYTDWDNGIFTDNFQGYWGAINEFPVFMELSYESEDYNLYTVPVYLNGEEYCLEVYYEYDTEEWGVIGAIQGMDDSGMASKELRLLQEGDEIGIIWKVGSLSDDDDEDMVDYLAETIVVDENFEFGFAPLMDGQYVMVITMEDVVGNIAYAEGTIFDVEDGEITTTVLD